MDDELTRRRFLSNVSLGLSGLAGLVLSVPVVAYLLSPLLRAPHVPASSSVSSSSAS